MRENLDVGDIVLIIDKNVSRGKWSMGIVQDIYKGEDGKVRSVSVKSKSGTYDRPITKLTLVLSKAEYENSAD